REAIGVEDNRVSAIVNGVDTTVFAPAAQRSLPDGFPFAGANLCICGTVGRLQPVKNQVALVRAFVRALQMEPAMRARLRLAIVGEGPLRNEIVGILSAANVLDLAWLPGARDDVAQILRSFDVFALPSLAEGISNTILEAMASGLPIVATDVGGNGELIDVAHTGMLVAAGDDEALARALLAYATDRERARSAGLAGRARAERLYALDSMVARYASLYERLMAARSGKALPDLAKPDAGPTTETH
ncbi:MAG TPA: glycosyltransferase, partial [Casimicrobiaceae bacterium]|nr:glycosyltransferase [Casimicrobiaceae bacterium]